MSTATRRTFLTTTPGLLAAAQASAGSYFTLARRQGHWWFLTPDNKPFFSLGLNHIDSAALRFPENGWIWRDKYANSQQLWLEKSVRRNLLDWGFNSVGWVQEVVTRGLTNHRHSRNFTYEEYQWLNLPYCHMLPVANFHQWEAETRNPDIKSPEFADWCDYVGREHCARLAGDPKLIGYFYLDCPTWVHTTRWNKWKGPMFDPERLASEAGRRELFDLATHYYRTIHEAVRRYDAHHLILGDRYEANAPLPMEVVRAASEYVDVLSFQDFRQPVAHLADWHQKTGKPVLWADGAAGIRQDGYSLNDGAWYARQLAGLRRNPGCVGTHLCGAYIRNNCRRRGLLDPNEKPDQRNLDLIRKANGETEEWVRGH